MAYVYASDRKAERPFSHLKGFRGVLQVVGYAGYRTLAQAVDLCLAFCWSHVRRRFYKLAAAGPAPIASEARSRPGELYAVEAEIRCRSAEERWLARQAQSRLLLAALEPWLRARLEAIIHRAS